MLVMQMTLKLIDTNKTNGCIEVSCILKFKENNGSQAEQVSSHDVGDGDSSQVIKLMGVGHIRLMETDRKSTRLNSSHIQKSRMPSSA